MGVTRAAAGILIALGLGGPGAAQDGLVFSPDALVACFGAGGEADACIGAAAQACINATQDGFTPPVMVRCFAAEQGYWDAALTTAYQALLDDLAAQDAAGQGASASGGRAPALRKMQRNWVAYRDARCDYERSLWGDGPDAGPASAVCLMAETARQALFLEEQLAFE